MSRKLPFKSRNADATRAALLEAAQKVFSRTSYAQAGIREIAALAETSPAMLVRYYGSKIGIFEAAMTAAVPAASMLTKHRAGFGAFLAGALMDPANEIKPPMMMALASGDPDAAAVAEQVMYRQGILPLAEWLGGEQAMARATAITMTATGFALYLRQFSLSGLGDAERATLSDWFAVRVQALVDGEMP